MLWIYALGVMMLAGHIRAQCAQYYTIAPGDTLGNIANSCGTTVSYLAGLNPSISNVNVIYPCQTLCLPAGCTVGSGYAYCSTYATSSSCVGTYTVGSGDTLSAIASRCGIASYTTIASMNNIPAPYTIYPCQVLCLPTNCYSTTGYTNCATGVNGYTGGCANYYDVVPGDTLNNIASRCATTANTIASLSGISNANLIYPCQRLCLPAGCNIGNGYAGSCTTASNCAYTYSVAPGDTLNNIAAACGTTASTIASLSGIGNANYIYPCQVLCLPASCSIGYGYSTSCSATGYNTANGQCAYAYYVAPGDTLNNIAASCGTTAASLAAMNPSITNVNLIYPCQRLCLPAGCALGAGYSGCSTYAYGTTGGCAYSYTVAPGDTLNTIASRCGISSYTTIASLNNIANPNVIYPCQVLCLPSYCAGNVGYTSCQTGVSFYPSTCAGNSYYVAPGDTLNNIAARCGTTAQNLANLSGITNINMIYPCDRVCLPYGCTLSTTYNQCTSALSGCAYTYSVAQGDTLSSIASRCGTTYQTIASLSGIPLTNVNNIAVCQVVCLPYSCAAGIGNRYC